MTNEKLICPFTKKPEIFLKEDIRLYFYAFKDLVDVIKTCVGHDGFWKLNPFRGLVVFHQCGD